MFVDINARPEAGITSNQAYSWEKNNDLSTTLSLLDKNNHNLSKPEKELLLWHTRLGHAGFGWIQGLMLKRKGKHGEPPEPPVMPTRTNEAWSLIGHVTSSNGVDASCICSSTLNKKNLFNAIFES